VRGGVAERQAAEEAEVRAQDAASRALDEAARNRRLLYDADMQLADQLWDSDTGTAQAVESLLAAHVPRAGEEDLRDFAWYYQRRLLHEAVTLPAHNGWASVYFAPDGLLLTLDSDYVLRHLGKSSWRESRRVPLSHSPKISCFACSSDRCTIALGSPEGNVGFYDAKTGRARLSLKGAPSLLDLEFAGNGHTLVTIHADNKARLWDTSSGK